MRLLVRNRDFRILVLAHGFSALGDYLALIALTLRVHDLTASGWAISALLLAGLVPLVVLAPLAGYIVDRFETVRVLGLTAAAQTAVALGLAFAESVPAIVALFFVLSAGFAITQPAVFALTPTAAGPENTGDANAYLEIARWSGATAGPFLAGALTAGLGFDAAVLANACTFAIVAIATPFLRVRRPSDDEGSDPAAAGGRRGFTAIRRDRMLLLVVASVGVMVVFAAIDNVAEVFFAKDTLGAGEVGYGALVTAWTTGMVIGATLIARRIPLRSLPTGVVAAGVAGGAALLVAVAWPTLPLALIAFVIGGTANGVELVAMRTLIHHRVPRAQHGRVFAAYYGIVNGAQIAAMTAGGALVAGVGARASLAIGGGGTLLVGIVGLVFVGRLRRRGAAEPGYSAAAS